MKQLLWSLKLALTAVFLVGYSNAAYAEKRVAFVVGNSTYEKNGSSLANPVNDAVAMSKKLKQLGFVTVDGFDLSHADFETRIRDFARLSNDADLAVFFYAGHGIAVNGVNYLIPVDAKFEDETALDFEAVSVDFIAKLMRRSGGVSLLFLDACRNNPMAGTLARSMGQSSRSAVSAGLAEMKLDNPGRGLAIAFATSPGEVALDGDGEHSPFTSALLNHIGAENTDITEVMGRVTGQVYEETQKSQRPWLNTSLTGPVILNAIALPAAATVTPATVEKPKATISANSLEVEKAVYEMARASGRISGYQAYLDTFPNGIFAAFAKTEIVLLEQQEIDQKLTALEGDAATTPDSQVREVNSDPKIMVPSAEALLLPSNAATQSAIGMDWKQRREVQARLNLTGNDVGTPDGAIGPNTRHGILTWQDQMGFVPTGYLNHQQYLFLVKQTREDFTIWSINNPVIQPKRKASTKPKRKTAPEQKQNNNSIGAFIGGLATGIIISN